MASTITSKICTSVERAGIYSVLADETKVKQLSIVIQYVDINTAKIYELMLKHCPH